MSLRSILWCFLIFFACEPSVDMSKWQDIQKSGFLKKQLDFPRVRDAMQQAEESLKKMLLQQGINSFNINLYLRAFKQEQELEVWAKAKNEDQFKLIRTYPFCATSGKLGPKRKEGDRQIPEGFYHLSHYNPKSQFLLSLKINYPNAADKILGDPVKPGDHIYIHGDCQTIGCIPITDAKIQEVYLLSVLAKEEGKSTPVHIFPFKMNKLDTEIFSGQFPHLESFWQELKPGYDFFEKNKILPKVSVLENGSYEVK